MDVDVLGLSEYDIWRRSTGAALAVTAGFSSRVYVAEDVVIKEQILGFYEGAWHSLQLFREDVPGSRATREKIMDPVKCSELTEKHIDSILFFRTHKWHEEEIEPMEKASEHYLTPKMDTAFMVRLAHPRFRLGISAQEPLHVLWSNWDLQSGEMLQKIAKIGARKIANAIEKMASIQIAHLDWNPANIGMTCTERLQLIDWACSTKKPEVVLRKEFETHKESIEKMELLWRKAIMYKAFEKTWLPYADNEEFWKHIYMPMKRYARDASETCRHFLEKIAAPDTELDKVLDVKMFEEE